MTVPLSLSRGFLAAMGIATGVVLAAAPAGAATTGTLSVTSSSLTPGGSTDVTVVFTAGDTSNALLTVLVTPQSGATGSFTLSNPVTSTGGTSGSFNCALTPPNQLDCLWQTSGANTKDPGDQATVTVTATSSSNALGVFDATAYDDTLAATPGTGAAVGTAAVTVALPPTTTTTSTTTSTTTTVAPITAPTTATTVPSAAATTAMTAAAAGTRFARTGSDAAALALAAVGMITVGGGLLFAVRRRTANT